MSNMENDGFNTPEEWYDRFNEGGFMSDHDTSFFFGPQNTRKDTEKEEMEQS